MVSLRKAKLLLCFIHLFNLNFISARTALKAKCEALDRATFATRYFQGSCLTLSKTPGDTYDQARGSCKQFAYGHLLLPFNQAIRDLLVEMMNQISCVGPYGQCWTWIGLGQSSTGAEPSGGWYWQAKDAEMVANQNMVNWLMGEPNNFKGREEDCGAIDKSGKVFDTRCVQTNVLTACQYRDLQVSFRSEKNKRGSTDALIGQLTTHHTNICGNRCHGSPFCTAFSYSSTTKLCFLYIN